MKRSEIFFSVLLLPIDLAALLGAFSLSYYLRDAFGFLSPDALPSLAQRLKYEPSAISITFSHYLHYLGFIIPGMLVIFALAGLYTMRSSISLPRRLWLITVGVSMGEFFILLLFLLKKDFFLPRSVILYSWILGVSFVFLGRFLVTFLQRILRRYGIGSVRVGLVGENVIADSVALRLKKGTSSAYRLLWQSPSHSIPELTKQIQENKVDELVVVSDHYTNGELIALRNTCLEMHVGFSFVPSLLTELQTNFAVRDIFGLPMIEIRPTPLDGWGRVIKRIFDICASSIFLVLFSPLFLLIALLIKLFSPGPLVFKHKRIGKNKQSIEVWKFRTLLWEYCDTKDGLSPKFKEYLATHPEANREWQETFKLKDDPRVSWLGTFLRKSSLDELPQFFNVFTGSLSLVGPRPIVRDEVQKYGETARILFSVKPGATGLWQVSGRSDVSYEERIALDTDYIEHWNVFWDISIIIRTALVLIGGVVKIIFKKGSVGAY